MSPLQGKDRLLEHLKIKTTYTVGKSIASLTQVIFGKESNDINNTFGYTYFRVKFNFKYSGWANYHMKEWGRWHIYSDEGGTVMYIINA